MTSDATFLNAGYVAAATDGPLVAQNLQGNPFVGLRPFESAESVLFFGRDKQVIDLMQQLHRTRFLAVVGSSGCGKSSLIRAGLIPKLRAGFLVERRDRWNVVIMKPGAAPLTNMAAAMLEAISESVGEEEIGDFVSDMRVNGAGAVVKRLAEPLERDSASLLLLVDQFEELFRYDDSSPGDEPLAVDGDDGEPGDEEANAAVKERRREQAAKKILGRDEAMRFISIMLELARQREVPIYVVMTMRSDFLGECDAFRGLPEAITQSIYLVPRLNRQQREEAGENPVRLYGQAITSRLLDRVVNDVGDEPDQLPVMQHALMRTWEEWKQDHSDGESIDLRHYEAVGTIANALSLDADQALGEMEENEKLIAERMFQALVDIDAQGRRVRRPVHLNQVAGIAATTPQQVFSVVDYFRREGRCFLMLSSERLEDNPLIDISHESFIRQWNTLRKWVKAEIYSREVYTRLAGAALRCQENRGGLWTDPELQLALDWWAERNPNEAWGQRYNPAFTTAEEFLRDSQEQERKLKIQKEEDQLKQRESDKLKRQNLRLRRFTYALVLLAVLASVGFGGTFLSVRKARASAVEARASAAEAQKQRAAAEQQREEVERQRRFAEQQYGYAEQRRQDAEDAAKLATEEGERADAERLLAEKAREDLKLANERRIKDLAAVRKKLLGDLGGLYQQANAFSGDETEDQAVKTYGEILSIYDRDDVRAGKLSTLLLLGDKFKNKDFSGEEDAKKALGYYERALELFDTANKEEKQAKIDTLIKMGDLHNDEEDGNNAAKRYEEALREGYEPDKNDMRDVYLNLASIYAAGQTREERLKAIGYGNKQLSLINSRLAVANDNSPAGLKPPDLKSAKLRLLIMNGSLQYSVGERQQAKTTFERAIEFARTEGGEVGGVDETLVDIGLSLDRPGEEGEAERYFTRALETARQSNQSGSEALAYSAIGRGLYKQKKYDAAIRYLNLGLERTGPTRLTSAEIRRFLGNAYLGKGMKAEALNQYQSALLIYRALPTSSAVKSRILAMEKAIRDLEAKKN